MTESPGSAYSSGSGSWRTMVPTVGGGANCGPHGTSPTAIPSFDWSAPSWANKIATAKRRAVPPEDWFESRHYLGIGALTQSRRVGEPQPDTGEVTSPDLNALSA